MARVLVIWLVCLMGTGGVQAQSAPQAEPGDVVACLVTTDPMPIQYRTVLQSACVATALNLCLDQKGTIACIDGVIGAYRDLFYQVRVALPQSIPPGGYEPRLYRNALRRIDSTFAAERPCGGLSDLERARCRYQDVARAAVDLLTAARAAGVPVSP